MGDLVLDRIIPLIAYLREEMPLTLWTMFTAEHLQEKNIPSTLDCRRLFETDAYFDEFAKK